MRLLIVLSLVLAVVAVFYSTADAASVGDRSRLKTNVTSSPSRTIRTTKKQRVTPSPSTKKSSSTRNPTTKKSSSTTRHTTTKKPSSTTSPTTTKKPSSTTSPTTTKKPRSTTRPTTTKKPSSTTKSSTKQSTTPTVPARSTTTAYSRCYLNSLTTCDKYIAPGYTTRVNAWQGAHISTQLVKAVADVQSSYIFEDESTLTFQFDPILHNHIGDCSVKVEIYDTVFSSTHFPMYTYTCLSLLPTTPINIYSSQLRILLTNNKRTTAFDFSILVKSHDTSRTPTVNITWYVAGPLIAFVVVVIALALVIRFFRRRRLGYNRF